MPKLPAQITNGDFEHALKGWHVVSGTAFKGQPWTASRIGAAQVEIGGHPLVTLGGDYWHTPFPIGHTGASLIRVVTKTGGILDSSPFSISKRWLAFRLGGSAGGNVALELRVPAAVAKAKKRKALDKPDADGYVAVRMATPTGADPLIETAWDLFGKEPKLSLEGAAAKVRLRITAAKGVRRLLADDIRLEPKRPPPFHRELWGWADIHCHPMAQAGFGDVLAGHMHGPVEDLGSCLEIHGHEHGNLLRPVAFALGEEHHNDGSLATTGWKTQMPDANAELGFNGWPTFDEIIHIKTHQDWIRRAYEGGQRLMVALIVHNQMLAAISTATKLVFEAQSDRDTVEPQVQMLREFVAHNKDWCGLAKTPDDARKLIEANKMAFVLGLETDSINDWVKDGQFSSDPSAANREAIHQTIHCYFKYLHDLGVVQVNLIHLSDNAFGGMALYDVMFMVNSWQRRGVLPTSQDGFAPHQAVNPDEVICKPVTVASALWEKLKPAAQALGITSPPFSGVPAYGQGDRNANGLTVAGEVALLEAMRLGMVVDMDHMSEWSAERAFTIATTTIADAKYPLVSAHNGARIMAPRPPAMEPSPTDSPAGEERRSPHAWPSESMKSETQLGFIQTTKGMFGHGIAGADSRTFGTSLPAGPPVRNDCPGSSRTVAQGMQYIASRLETPLGLGTDWNALLAGPGPRFGPLAGNGLVGELDPDDDMWAKATRSTRLTGVKAQDKAVGYDTPIRDWRPYPFPDAKPATDLYRDQGYAGEGRFIWQAKALVESGADLTSQEVIDAFRDPRLDASPALDLALGLTNGANTGTDYYNAGAIIFAPATPVTGDPVHVQKLVDGLTDIGARWAAMRTPGAAPPMHRSKAGPIRDFDYNLDGLSHYGMLPDMLQDLKNVGLPPEVLTRFFGSAEGYIAVWERSLQAAAKIPHPTVSCP